MNHDTPQSSSPPTIDPVPREEFGKYWRWLTVVAGLALTATFFYAVYREHEYPGTCHGAQYNAIHVR